MLQPFSSFTVNVKSEVTTSLSGIASPLSGKWEGNSLTRAKRNPGSRYYVSILLFKAQHHSLIVLQDRELEESEERHRAELRVYQQKVQHLMYEQEQSLAELKAENMVSYSFA